MQKTITEIPTAPALLEDLGYLFPKETSKQKHKFGIYKCQCGKEFKAYTANIKNGNTKSCGCYQKQRTSETNIIHGMLLHQIYAAWRGMIIRCTNTNSKNYKSYGARGIIVCERWKNSFENFSDDMLSTWKHDLSIDRIDNNGNYEPSNCRWTNKAVQARNTRLLRVTNKSGYRGVCFNKLRNKWMAQICVNNKIKHLGYFNIAIDAAKSYDKYIIDNKLEHTINGV